MSSYAKSLEWYQQALKPLGYKAKVQIEHEGTQIAGLGDETYAEASDFWIWQGKCLDLVSVLRPVSTSFEPESSVEAVPDPACIREPRPSAGLPLQHVIRDPKRLAVRDCLLSLEPLSVAL